MATKSHAKLEVNGQPNNVILVSALTGGATIKKSTEVPSTEIPNTMVKIKPGGREYEDIELTVTEMIDEGKYIEDAHTFFTDWDDKGDRRTMALVWYKDENFKNLLKRDDWVGVMPLQVGTVEFDRSSGDARTFTVTLTHKGKTEKSTTQPPVDVAA